MYQTTAKIDGMMCGMCEAHICDAIRKAFPDAKKVRASRGKGVVTFRTEAQPDEAAVRAAIEETGYTFVSATTEA